jgi:acetamidase/formamidase
MRRLDGRQEAHLQFRWAADVRPVFQVDPGEEFMVNLFDSSTGQLGPESAAADLTGMRMERVDAVAGPIEVCGAEPGDAVDIEILEIVPADWGWSGIFRDFGFLRGRFADDLVIWALSGDIARPTRGFLRPVDVPVRPMLGVLGVAPESGIHPLIPPGRFGGNMDHRVHRAGAVVRLPVFQAGAMLGLGDPHAAQGDGEVCGTGIETPATVRMRVTVHPGAAPSQPRVVSREPPPTTAETSWSALGIGPSMEEAARGALENLIAWLVENGWSPEEGYLLASILGNLRLAEVVDLPNYVVALDFPALFGSPPDEASPR